MVLYRMTADQENELRRTYAAYKGSYDFDREGTCWRVYKGSLGERTMLASRVGRYASIREKSC